MILLNSCCQGQHIPLGPLIQPPFQGYQRQGGQKSLLLTKGTGLNIHILTEQQLFHLGHLPFQVVHVAGGDGDEQIQIVKILIVAQAVFQEVAAADGAVQVIKVGVGVAGLFDFTAVNAQLLAQLPDHPVLGLAGEKHIHVDPIPGVDQQA